MMALAIGFVALNQTIGISIYVENRDRRELLHACLVAADISFDIQPNNYFKAKPNSVKAMEAMWFKFEQGRITSPDQCKS